jgi:hypothetical protein
LFLLLPSMQTALPVLHSMVPLRQAAPGFDVQPLPALQAEQKPLLQTPLMHAVPFMRLAPSTHTALPVEQSVVPRRQAALGFVVHEAPALQATQDPALHTPVEQVVPFMRLVPSTQTAVPVAQLVVPKRHAAAGLPMQEAPALQGLHAPARHAPPGQVVPLVRAAPSTHAGAPELHSVTPWRQAAPGLPVQDAPCVHETHWSIALQTRLLPQLAPVPRRLPLTQTGAPDVQLMEPLKQGLAGGQVAPAVQLTHMPLASHTCPEPQVEPGAFVGPSMHRWVPVLQSKTPLRQTPGLVPHTPPEAHATQAPEALQTCPAPQAVPGVTVVPVSTQTLEPLVQSVRPVRQGAPGLVVHGWLATHAPQLPSASHTWPAPHIVPAGLLLPSTHVWAPVAHEVRPLRQAGLGLLGQAWLATQPTQLPPALHTWLSPHEVPGVRGLASTHVWVPVAHEVTPVRQPGLGLLVQVVPATQATQLPVPVQTRSGPQAVPAVTVVESTQRVVPVLQSMTPVRQGAPGLVAHAAPGVQAPQKPLPSHTWALPQDVPASRAAPSAHCCIPVAQLVTPARHGAALVAHPSPARHATQVPVALQTWSTPHGEPAGLRASSTQTGRPALQSVMPRRQAAPGLVVQGAPETQARHAPVSSHTRSAPHEVPAGAAMPSSQRGEAPQTVTPRRQGAPAFDPHDAPGTHCRQFPPTQTRSTPHKRPEGAGGPSTQVEAPEAQRTTPSTQGVLGFPEHRAPSSHMMQSPLEVHTRPTPQALPAARARVLLTHAGLAPHVVSPSRQGLGFAVQGWPSTQVTQVPPRQMRPVPQATPVLVAGPSAHEESPASHRVTPARHGAPPLPVHGASGTHPWPESDAAAPPAVPPPTPGSTHVVRHTAPGQHDQPSGPSRGPASRSARSLAPAWVSTPSSERHARRAATSRFPR